MTPEAKDSTRPAESFGEHYEAQASQPPPAMDAFWMPFSANRQFKREPRMLVLKWNGGTKGTAPVAAHTEPVPAGARPRG